MNAWVGAWASGGSMWADTRSTGGALCRCWRRRVVGHSGVNFVGVSNGMVLVLTFLILPERIHRCFLEKGGFRGSSALGFAQSLMILWPPFWPW